MSSSVDPASQRPSAPGPPEPPPTTDPVGPPAPARATVDVVPGEPPAESPGVPPSEPPSEPQPHKRRRSFWRELPVLIVIAFVVALLIKTFVLQAFYIPSASMEPTLMVGDRVLVEKVGYRFGSAGHGDVVVFERDLPTAVPLEEDEPFWTDIVDGIKGLFGFPTGDSQDFIKRVIAVGGDTIEGREGKVFLNGEELAEPYLPPGTETSSFGPVEVPDGEIFVMGDNRGNSDDSRSFGPISESKVIGHAFLLVWPPGDFDTL
ncbi:MAG TPA: signal peptidase I [Actinomycetota bacterium]